MKKFFIALDIDGVLNDKFDNQFLIYYQNQFQIFMKNVKQNDNVFSQFHHLKFFHKYENHFGDFINKHKLFILNALITKMLNQNYQVYVYGISSWFCNINDKDLSKLHSFLELPSEVALIGSSYTSGNGNARFQSFCTFVAQEIKFNTNDYKMLYLDDISVEENFVNILTNNVDLDKSKLFIPQICGGKGINYFVMKNCIDFLKK